MKINYYVTAITFVINLFMAFSLNSFTSSFYYLPALFLYFLSNLAAFLEKIFYYRERSLSCEQKISFFCFVLSSAGTCLCIANTISCIEINFHQNQDIYRILIQGRNNSFFTFNSLDITFIIFFIIFAMPVSYSLLWIIPYFRDHGYTKELIHKITFEHKKILSILILVSLLVGLIGVALCHYKYIKYFAGFGSPQYLKYFITFWVIALSCSYTLFLRYYKKKLINQSQSN